MKIKVWVPVLAMMIILLTACGSNANSISDGSKKMKDTLVELKKSVDAADSAKAKKGADDLEANWSKFEDNLKSKDAGLYAKIEDPLHLIAAGVKAEKLDAPTLNKSIADLNSLLDQAQNLK
jgi:hypothetical protein